MDLSSIGLTLIILGFVLAVIAVVLMAFRGKRSGQTKGAGIVFIGPIPIIFGSDKESVRVLMILAIILIAVFLALMLIPTLLFSR